MAIGIDALERMKELVVAAELVAAELRIKVLEEELRKVTDNRDYWKERCLRNESF